MRHCQQRGEADRTHRDGLWQGVVQSVPAVMATTQRPQTAIAAPLLSAAVGAVAQSHAQNARLAE